VHVPNRAQGSYNQFLASVCESIKICNGCGRLVNAKSRYDCDVVLQNLSIVTVFESFVLHASLCLKASVENPGEGTSTVASREENPQTNTIE